MTLLRIAKTITTSFMRPLLTAIPLLFFSTVSAQFQGLVINEFSQGDAGSKEYIELLVAGKRTCSDSTADIRGWIVDDQNGWYGSGSLGTGHYRFKDVPNWSAVPIGSIIVLYNSAVNGKNNSITLPDDVTDANKDFIYVVPINSSAYLEEYDTEPSNLTGAAYVYPPATATVGYTGTSNLWVQHIALNNGSDVICTISPQDRTTHYFSISYGYPVLPGFRNPSVSVAAVNAGNNCYLMDSSYTTAASWGIAAVPANETPGLPNGGINTVWILAMRITPKPVASFITACSIGAYTFFNQTFAVTGAYTVLTSNSNGCVDTNSVYVVIKKTELTDTANCDSVVYKGLTFRSDTTIADTVSSTVISCDSLVRMVNIAIKKRSSSLTQACVGISQTYTFNSLSLSASGNYAVTLTNAKGCDSIARLVLLVTGLQTNSISGCGTVTYKGITYTSSGIIYDTVKSLVMNCDSLINQINIQVNPVKTTYLSACANEGDTYLFNGQSLITSGLYSALLNTSLGCDSMVKLYLVFKKTVTQNLIGCDSILHNGVLYYTGTTLKDTIRSVVGNCDSLVTIVNITINPNKNSYRFVCLGVGQVYNFNGQQLSVSGNYITTYSTAVCDSLEHLNLVVATEQMQTIQGCGIIMHNGISYTSSAIIKDTIRSIVTTCDSIYKTTTIVIRPKPVNFVSACISQGQSYNFNGQLLTSSGNYSTVYIQPNGCDSTVNLYLVVSQKQFQMRTACNMVIYNATVYTSSTSVSDTVRSLITSCDSIINIVTIIVNPKPLLQISNNATICRGDSVRLGATSLNGSVNWIGFGQMDSITVKPLATTDYTVDVTDLNGCTNSAGVTVFVQDFNLEVFATPATVLSGQPVFLQSVSVLPYSVSSWQPTNLFQNQNAVRQKVITDSSHQIIVRGQTLLGCKDTAYASIIIIPLDDIYIPSGFTPNGDGKNELVNVYGAGIKEIDFKIFNRWGQLLFFTLDKGKAWDGRFAGLLQPAGTYVYVVRVKKTNGQVVEKKGTVTLIR